MAEALFAGYEQRREGNVMKMVVVPAVLALTLAAVLPGSPANAAGCLKGAVVGGVAGHVAGHHGLLGAGAGCVIGHHEAAKHRREREHAARENAHDDADR